MVQSVGALVGARTGAWSMRCAAMRAQERQQYDQDCGGITFVNCLRAAAEVPASGGLTPSGMVAL